MTAAREYKARIAELTAGFDDDAERNAKRVRQLEEEVAELGKELKAASDQRVVARIGNVLAWEDALEILWVESSWMKMRPFPKPDRFAKGDPAELVIRVEACVAELRALVQRAQAPSLGDALGEGDDVLARTAGCASRSGRRR